MKPYERDISRVRAMYRLAGASPGGRVLELCFGSEPTLNGRSSPDGLAITCFLWNSSLPYSNQAPAARGIECIADYRRSLPFAAGSFDFVFIHRGLDLLISADRSFRSRRALVDLIARISDVLASGGVFAALVSNCTWFGRCKELLLAPRRDSTYPSTLFSIHSCRAILDACAFTCIQVFNVVPHPDAPLRLINTDSDLSRLAFRRELEMARSNLSAPGYLARRLSVELGLNRLTERSILFWGRKQ
jgi:hypothetical protein